MTTMLVMLLMGLALPSFTHFWTKAQEQSYLERLEKGLSFARQQALLRHAIIGFCQSNNQKQCANDAGSGFIVFVDDHDKLLLYAERFSMSKKNLYWRGFPYQKHLQFLPNGMTNNENGSFWYCSSQHQNLPAWLVVVNKAGRARVVTNISLDQDQGLRALSHGNSLPESRIRCPV